nr:hypothetical protein [Streptomyces sp. Tu 2975]
MEDTQVAAATVAVAAVAAVLGDAGSPDLIAFCAVHQAGGDLKALSVGDDGGVRVCEEVGAPGWVVGQPEVGGDDREAALVRYVEKRDVSGLS